MATKKLEMTPEIKTKLKRDLRSFLQPLTITIESDNDTDHTLIVERLTNKETFEIADVISDIESDSGFISAALRVVEEIILPKIKSWVHDDDDYTQDKEILIKYVEPSFIMNLFSKLQG